MRCYLCIMLAILICCLLAMSPVSAAKSPDVLLQEQTDLVMNELRKDDGAIKKDPGKLRALVEKLIFPMVDFRAMAILTLGRNWRMASPQQQETFIRAFKDLLVRTYSKSLSQYANQEVSFLKDKTRLRDNYATIHTELVPGNGKPNIAIIYSMRNKGGGWKAYDLTIEGLSLVKNYRSSFAYEIKSTSLEALIARLEQERLDHQVTATSENQQVVERPQTSAEFNPQPVPPQTQPSSQFDGFERNLPAQSLQTPTGRLQDIPFERNQPNMWIGE